MNRNPYSPSNISKRNGITFWVLNIVCCSCPLCNVHFMKLCKFCWWEMPDRLFESPVCLNPSFSWLNIVRHHFSWFYLVLHPNDCYIQMFAKKSQSLLVSSQVLLKNKLMDNSPTRFFSQHWRLETPMFHCSWWLYIISLFFRLSKAPFVYVTWSKLAMAHIRGMVWSSVTKDLQIYTIWLWHSQFARENHHAINR